MRRRSERTRLSSAYCASCVGSPRPTKCVKSGETYLCTDILDHVSAFANFPLRPILRWRGSDRRCPRFFVKVIQRDFRPNGRRSYQRVGRHTGKWMGQRKKCGMKASANRLLETKSTPVALDKPTNLVHDDFGLFIGYDHPVTVHNRVPISPQGGRIFNVQLFLK
jgi:hypothetical protein